MRRFLVILTATVVVAGLCPPTLAVQPTAAEQWSRAVTVARAGQLFWPAVERQTDGRVVTVWTQENSAGRSVWLAWRIPGEPWSEPMQVSNQTQMPGGARSVIVPGSSHTTRVIWTEGDEPAELWTRVLRPDGHLGDARPIGAEAAPNGVASTHVAYGRDGSVAVLALDPEGRKIVLVKLGSGDWAPSPPLPAHGTLYGLALGAGGAVVAVVSGEERSSTTPVLAVSWSGGAWTSEQIGPRSGHSWYTPDFDPAIRVEANANGTLVVAWVDVDQDGTQSHVIGHRSSVGAWDFHPMEDADTCNAWHHICADLAIADDGSVAVVWEQPADGDEVDVVMARRDQETGTWETPQAVVQDVRKAWSYYTQNDERINLVDGGDLVIAWHIASGPRLFAQCLADAACTAAGDPDPPKGYEFVHVAPGPDASATMVWQRDCRRGCLDALRSRTLRPVTP